MPTEGPRPPDIVFDHAAAQAAVDALRGGAAVLRDVDLTRFGAALVARRDFAGVHADSFEDADRALGRDSADASAEMLALATVIEAGAAEAAGAQRERALDQSAWDREAARERPLPVGVR